MELTVVCVLHDAPAQALRCLHSIAALPDDPPFEVVVVDDGAVGCESLLAGLEGDVAIVRTGARTGLVASWRAALERVCGEHVLLLAGTPEVAPAAPAALLAALRSPTLRKGSDPFGRVGDDLVNAATPGRGACVAAPAVLARREDLAAVGLADAPDGHAVAAVVAALAQRGEVRAVPGAEVLPAGRRTGAARRAPGEAVEVSVVIPTLDAASERVRRCVAAVQATLDAPHEIVLIDNGAPPQGFTAPVNAGLRAARGRYAVVMNDDVEPLPGWWAPLRAALDAGAAVVFPETVDGFMRHDFAAWCFALSRSTLERHAAGPDGLFDPDLVVWYQDTDLLERLRAGGEPPVHVATSRIRHGLSETVETEDPALRAWIQQRIVADRAAFERKHSTAAGASRSVQAA